MQLKDNLGEMIAAHMSVPGDVAVQKPAADFIISNLRDAIFESPAERLKTLSDVAELLGCRAEDLKFLYADLDKTSNNADVMVPDFRAHLMALAD